MDLPHVLTLCHSWYKRSETGFRVAVFFSSATVAGAFSKLLHDRLSYMCSQVRSGGLLAAGIAKMDGVGGRPG